MYESLQTSSGAVAEKYNADKVCAEVKSCYDAHVRLTGRMLAKPINRESQHSARRTAHERYHIDANVIWLAPSLRES